MPNNGLIFATDAIEYKLESTVSATGIRKRDTGKIAHSERADAVRSKCNKRQHRYLS